MTSRFFARDVGLTTNVTWTEKKVVERVESPSLWPFWLFKCSTVVGLTLEWKLSLFRDQNGFSSDQGDSTLVSFFSFVNRYFTQQ